MTEASTELDFSNVGRNDPCPCGSGKKFKKCHYKTVQIQMQAQKQQVSLGSFVRPGQYPFQWLKGIQMLVNRRDWAVLHEVFEEGSPAHQAFPSVEGFVEKARSSSDIAPVSGADYKVRRFHTVDEFAFIMGVRNTEDRRVKDATFEVLALRNTPAGYRITHMERVDVPKTDGMEDPLFESFDCYKEIYEAVKVRKYDRPVIPRYNPESGRMELPEGVADTTGSVAADGAMIEAANDSTSDDDVAPAAPVVTLGGKKDEES
jgi:hypothetical protein